MAKLPYLARSGCSGRLIFRRVIPVPLRPHLGKREFVVSLKSADFRSVRPEYHRLVAHTDELLRQAEAKVALQNGSASDTDADALCREHHNKVVHFEAERRSTLTRRAMAYEPAFWQGEVVPIPYDLRHKPRSLDPTAPQRTASMTLAEIYRRDILARIAHLSALIETRDTLALARRVGSVAQPALSEDLTYALVAAEIQALQSFVTANDLPPSPPTVPPPRRSREVSQVHDASSDDPLLSTAVKEWVSAHAGKVWDAERRYLCNAVLSDFIQIVGDRPISQYTRANGRNFRQVYERLPANASKRIRRLGLTGRSVEEIADAAERAVLQPQHARTANKKLQIVGACFRWLADQYDACAPNPVERMRVVSKGLKVAANEQKDPFTPEQLQIIFSAPVFTGCESESGWKHRGQTVLRGSEKFWLPLLGLYAGARLNELCQLRGADVSRIDDIAYVTFTKEMRLKTASSVRSVPLHEELIRLGFLDFVQSRPPEERLFPDIPLASSGRYSDSFGKHFRRFLEHCGIKTPRLDFHSFRHTFVAAARSCGIDSETRERLIGHVYKGEGSR